MYLWLSTQTVQAVLWWEHRPKHQLPPNIQVSQHGGHSADFTRHLVHVGREVNLRAERDQSQVVRHNKRVRIRSYLYGVSRSAHIALRQLSLLLLDVTAHSIASRVSNEVF